MAEHIPARTLIKSNTPRDIPVAGQADLLSLTYDFAGQTKTLDDFVKESSTLGLLVVKDGQIEYEQYFQGTSDESLYTSWSMAKSFVATVIAKAVHDGLIESWDDPAEKYAPQYKGSDFGATSIRALLDMASGIEFDENYASETSDIRPFFFGAFIQQKDPDSLLLKFKRSRAEYNDFEYISPTVTCCRPFCGVCTKNAWLTLCSAKSGSRWAWQAMLIGCSTKMGTRVRHWDIAALMPL